MLRYAVLALPLLAGACATIIDGTKQDILVETPNVPAARCTLSNESGSWTVPSTPGSVEVKRTKENLQVACAANGATGEAELKSGLNNWVFGNILAGGVIGLGVDMGSGGWNEYPESVAVPMQVR
jgi:hypothetical protein